MLVGCGSPPPQWTCEGTGFASVYADADWDASACDQFKVFAGLSKRILVESGAVTAERLDASRARANVRVLDSERFNDPISGSLLGRNDNGNITIGWHASILPHEELHTIDYDRGELLTFWHHAWTEKGYFALDDLMVFTTGDWVRNCAGWRQLTTDQRDRLLAAGWPVREWEADTACEVKP